MFPKNIVVDEDKYPKDFDELLDLIETEYKVEHERTTLESIRLGPDGILETPTGQYLATQDFWESAASAIGMPLSYAQKISPELFCDNFSRRQAETTVPLTICRIGSVACGLVIDRRLGNRYSPASSGDVLRAIRWQPNLEFRRASVSLTGLDLELIHAGMVVEPVIGDVIEVGVSFTNSETGNRQLKATGYSYRLVCTNGATMADSLGVARWPNDPRMTPSSSLRGFERQFNELCQSLAPVASLYDSIVDRWVPEHDLWNVWRRVAYLGSTVLANNAIGLRDEERRELAQRVRLRDAREEPVVTSINAYDLHNRITHAAHGQRLRIRRGLQQIGGELLSDAVEWPRSASMN